ncbi:MAG: DUF6599 family protein [Vicinamibacterales bacterium]
MIRLATLSLLAASPHPAEGLPAAQSPPQHAAGSVAGGVGADTIVSLPKQAGQWVRPDAPRRIDEETIFDYMDGAGELYLAYRFEHLDVYEYSAPEKRLGTIKVELYWMKSPDDAFGLLSNDWGGEVLDLHGRGQSRHSHPAVPSHDALYGGGLLRFWSQNLYGRVMASRESPESRAQVLAIARSIVKERPANGQPPEILSRIPVRLGERFALRPDRTCFFRSHYVLNSVYYLAPNDVLGLGPAVDASVSEYRPAGTGGTPLRLIQAVYPSADAAAAALRTFLKLYVPVPAGQVAEKPVSAAANAEGKWVGWAAADRSLAIVLEAPGERDAKELASAALAALLHQ